MEKKSGKRSDWSQASQKSDTRASTENVNGLDEFEIHTVLVLKSNGRQQTTEAAPTQTREVELGRMDTNLLQSYICLPLTVHFLRYTFQAYCELNFGELKNQKDESSR